MQGLKKLWLTFFMSTIMSVIEVKMGGHQKHGIESSNLFHEKFSRVSFTKVQIQDKERELKRDYKVLKEARKQSGVLWDERLCRIEAEEPIWDNIIMSFPKAKKFRTKSFPLFEALGELYDGHTTEGTMNFTSLDPFHGPQPSHVTQPSHGTQLSHATQPSQGDITQATQPNYNDEESEVGRARNVQDDDDEVRVVEKPTTTTSVDRRGRRVTSSRNKDPAALSDKSERAGQKRRQDGRVVDMMGRFLELKEKEAEVEAVERTGASAAEDEFPITVRIAKVDEMEELHDDEKVDAYDVFKDSHNRAIFMTAKDSTRLKWLRKKIRGT